MLGISLSVPDVALLKRANSPGIRISGRTLLENSVQGTAIGTLSVFGGTGIYTFTLSDTAGSRVKVAGTNGVNVQAGATASDRETAASYNITVHADNGAGSTFDQPYSILILDANDNAPVITSNGGGSTASVSVPENTRAITTVTATDADSSSVVTYSISGGADASKVTINAATGVVQFGTAPDFEAPTDADANNTYVFVVMASDGTNSDTQTITVTVTDVADGIPDTTAPTITSSATPTVAENAAFSLALTANETVTWTKTGGADVALFTLAGSTLSMVARDFEAPADANADNAYVVQVTATDTSGNATNQTITLTVTDVDESGFPEIRNYVAVGDSITDSARGATATGGGYALASYNLANPVIATFNNQALSGNSVEGLISEAAIVDALLQPGQANILSVFIGANNHPDTGWLNTLAGYCDARRAAGWYVLLGTLLPQTASGTFNAARATANPELRLWTASGSVVPGKHADRIFDFAADPIMGVDATASNAAYFPDGLHPSFIGQARMRDIFWPVLDAAMSNVTSNPTITTTGVYSTEAGGFDTIVRLRADRGVTWSVSGSASLSIGVLCELNLTTNTPGAYTTTVTATDGNGHAATQSFTWTVASPPVGYGPNLVVNGNALNGIRGFITTADETLWFTRRADLGAQPLSVVDKIGGGKEFKLQGDGGGYPQVAQNFPVEDAASYKCDAVIRKGTSVGTPIFRVDGASGVYIGSNATVDTPITGTLVASGTNTWLLPFIDNGGSEVGNSFYSQIAIRKIL